MKYIVFSLLFILVCSSLEACPSVGELAAFEVHPTGVVYLADKDDNGDFIYWVLGGTGNENPEFYNRVPGNDSNNPNTYGPNNSDIEVRNPYNVCSSIPTMSFYDRRYNSLYSYSYRSAIDRIISIISSGQLKSNKRRHVLGLAIFLIIPIPWLEMNKKYYSIEIKSVKKIGNSCSYKIEEKDKREFWGLTTSKHHIETSFTMTKYNENDFHRFDKIEIKTEKTEDIPKVILL